MNHFKSYLEQWTLIPDGRLIITPSSQLLPVKYNNMPCMLKIALIEEEQIGGEVMVWWNGQGAAKVLLYDDKALLMERAQGENSLLEMVKQGKDDESSQIICSVVAKLHSVSHKPLPRKIVPLGEWFRSLNKIQDQYGGLLKKAYLTSQQLLQNMQDVTVLHGDIHHQNILDFGSAGWLAIDPKGLLGDPYYDYANIFCNPDEEIATSLGRLERQAHLISRKANLDYHRLLQWIFAYAGLSAAWHFEEGSPADLALKVAEISSSLL
ncbi:aminoglycoside phosphotransferase family protein [Legionella pneumophila serogroup 1]|uniref:3'-kinase n=1 Tax=Legionella pneumophila TaxID=446 RepID=A0AAN5PQH7_LEGPN|nr:aminoglycoside phosphotransferase family protein [Legionella pneumophila]AMV14861.1 Aminoglycoside/hydroxyurea antibiotic resistance kinase [Legionella pneumophila]ANN93046.1 3'-kinase [Legionella pneumophila]MCH9061555.1 3'-kinase [Legionella pneumophila serogroup 1]MCH9064345.1 3'-kinase [Legionella pneumophila serogroup 1]MCH9066757.1 3'-kinase [Legionella pneumophila serogroup 1]